MWTSSFAGTERGGKIRFEREGNRYGQERNKKEKNGRMTTEISV